MEVFNKRLFKGTVHLSFISLLLLSSCVNRISEENEVFQNGENIPLKFVAGIQTRVANNNFETGDEVGFFALAGNTTLPEERYADNLRFTRSEDGVFQPDETLFYPDDGVTLHLFSYYPYNPEGIPTGESGLSVEISADQSLAANYSASDFLVTEKENVAASKDAVKLNYEHKFFRLKITLVPGTGEDTESLAALSPTLSVNGFYTRAEYDFHSKSFAQYAEETDITPAGEWTEQEGKLVGKELILIPQETTEGYQHITLEAGGKTYTTFLPASLQLQSGKQRELEITFVRSEDILISRLDAEIGEWEGTETDQATSETLHKYVNIDKLTFENSNVYKVTSKGKQVAEICKEYLVATDFSAQAIVAYPVKEDGTTDLTQGIVAQLTGQTGKVHGGSVSWDENGLTYTPGTLSACSKVYVLPDGKVTVSASQADGALSVLTLEDVVRDARGNSIHHYPIVKIGTQYWMRDNLQATMHRDGEEIPLLSQMDANVPGYLQSAAGNCFYTGVTALSESLLPEGWELPDWEDWRALDTYLEGDMSVVKSGTWISAQEDGTPQPATNLSGFNAAAVGMFSGIHQTVYENKYVQYWTMNADRTDMDAKSFYLNGDTNTMNEENAKSEKWAFAIRCIRK